LKGTEIMIAVIAHQAKKHLLRQFVVENAEFFRKHQLIATRATGLMLQEEDFQIADMVPPGPEGGDVVIAARICREGDIVAVFFFCDPDSAHPHEADISALIKMCNRHNVPLATNIGTARAILKGIEND
jgi:methylglyoxal synthase